MRTQAADVGCMVSAGEGQQWCNRESSPSAKVVDSYMGCPTFGPLPANLTDIKLLLPLYSALPFHHFRPNPVFADSAALPHTTKWGLTTETLLENGDLRLQAISGQHLVPLASTYPSPGSSKGALL